MIKAGSLRPPPLDGSLPPDVKNTTGPFNSRALPPWPEGTSALVGARELLSDSEIHDEISPPTFPGKVATGIPDPDPASGEHVGGERQGDRAVLLHETPTLTTGAGARPVDKAAS